MALLDQKPNGNPVPARSPRFPLEKVPGKLPVASIPEGVDPATVASQCIRWLEKLSPEIFDKEVLWRDLYALTGLPRTFFVQTDRWYCSSRGPRSANLVDSSAIHLRNIGKPSDSVLWARWNHSRREGRLENMDPHHHSGAAQRPNKPRLLSIDVECHGLVNNGSGVFDCCIIGAGFAGLCLSARLKALRVNYVALEKNALVGDNWRNRYESATFHTGRNMSDFPLNSVFTEDDPFYLNQRDLARGYEQFAQKNRLNIWTSSAVLSASFDTENETWILQVSKDGAEIKLRTRHFVLAVGGAGQTPVMPQLKGRERFKGTVLHSSEYKSSSDWKGKNGVVVGTANTGHDVAEDMLAWAGLTSVTMVQRSSTQIYPTEYNKFWADSLYNTNTLEEADRAAMSFPNSIIRQMSLGLYHALSSQEPTRYDGLEKVGFRVERPVDIWTILCGKQGGHYVDVGTSKKIADGLIKSDASLVGFTESSLLFHDGSTLEADSIVFCTGFANDVRSQAFDLVGPEIGEKLEDYFDVDEEGEILGAWKPQSQPGIWYTGGGLHFGRFFSRFLALQIQAATAGTPLKLYRCNGIATS